MWKKFEVVMLTKNHRQGASLEFAELLNRARVLNKGQMSEEDIEIWQSRVRPKGHPDLEKAAINLVCTNKLKANMNMLYHVKHPGEEIKVKAVTWMATKKSYTPAPKPDGTIEKTGFMKDLRLKLGEKVMMIKNVRTADSLTNGQLGVLIGVLKDKEGGVTHFKQHAINACYR